MLLLEIDKLALAGWPKAKTQVAVNAVTAQVTSKPSAKKMKFGTTPVSVFEADPATDLYYDDPIDTSNALGNGFKRFFSPETAVTGDLPRLGSNKVFMGGRPTNGLMARAQMMLRSAFLRDWSKTHDVTLEPPLPADGAFGPDETQSYRLPVLGKSPAGWVVLGVLQKPANLPADEAGIDWALSIALMRQFPAPEIRQAAGEVVAPLLQKSSGGGLNCFGSDDTSQKSERIRLWGGDVKASPSQISLTLDAALRQLSIKCNVGSKPDGSMLLMFPADGQADRLAQRIASRWVKQGDGEGSAPVTVSWANADEISNVYLAFRDGSNAGQKICVSRVFPRMHVRHWQTIDDFNRKHWLQAKLVGLQAAATLGYLDDDGEPDHKKGAGLPSCVGLWTEVFLRELDGQEVASLWPVIWRLFTNETRVLPGRYLERGGGDEQSALVVRQLVRLVPVMTALDDYLRRYREASADTIEASTDTIDKVLNDGIAAPAKRQEFINMLKLNTQSLVDPLLWADLLPTEQKVLVDLHPFIAPGRTEAQQRETLHGLAVAICLSVMVRELVANGRNASRTNGLHPSHMRGDRLVGVAVNAMNQLEVLSQSDGVTHSRVLGKHIIAAATASKKDTFNLGFILGLSELSIKS